MSRDNKPQIEARRRQVAALLLTMHNPSVRRIADALAQMDPPFVVAKSTVGRDIQACREEWRAERVRDVDEWVSSELARLSLAEEQLWRAMRKSSAPSRKTLVRSRQVLVGDEVRTLTNTWTETTEREADPRYFKVLVDIVDRRSKLLGLDRPRSIDLNAFGAVFTVDLGNSGPPLSGGNGGGRAAVERLRGALEAEYQEVD